MPVPAADEPAAPERPKGVKRAAARRWIRRLAFVITAVLATFFITIFTVDIGNITVAGKSIKTLAESYGSRYLKRPLHIDMISALLTPGMFVVEGLVIEGPTKD